MNETTAAAARPLSITIICILGFASAIFSIPVIISSFMQQGAQWLNIYFIFINITLLACMVGLWMMKKWGVYLYLCVVAVNQGILVALGIWNPMSLLLPAIIIYFALKHVSSMT